MYLNYLPTFKQIEVNNSVGLRSGHVLAQMPAASALTMKTVGTEKFIENGTFVSLDADGKIANYIAGQQVFFIWTEEIPYVVNGHKYYATLYSEEEYPRAVGMYVGDAITTDNFSGTLTGAKYAKIVNGVATLQTAADANTAFLAVPTTMADGTPAVELTLYRVPAATAATGT